MFNVYKNQQSRQKGSRNMTGPKTLPTIWHTYMKLVTKYQIPVINSCLEKYLGRTDRDKQYTSQNEYCSFILFWAKVLNIILCISSFVTYIYPHSPKGEGGILFISVRLNSCWEKCNEKCAYMFNVYKNQLSRQTGSRNMTGPKTLPTIWFYFGQKY
jgi:hypothetical protein